MEPPTTIIDSPEQLHALAARLHQRPPNSPATNLRLRLLHPLATAKDLTACRNPGSRFMRDGNGNKCGPSNDEYLNIKPITERWRAAMVALPTSLHRIVFDLETPEPIEDTERVYWARKMPSGGGLGVMEIDTIVTVLGMATVMKMRSHGQVRFALMDGRGPSHEGFLARLETSLQTLSRQGT